MPANVFFADKGLGVAPAPTHHFDGRNASGASPATEETHR